MKKKVRYAAGALGALGVMPALGLATPAAAAAPQAPARTGRTVNLAPLAPANTCTGNGHSTSIARNNGLAGDIDYSIFNGCVGFVSGRAAGNHAGLDLRLRYYDDGKQIYPTSYLHNVSSYNGHSTVWDASPHKPGISQVCEAVTTTGPGFQLRYGPICKGTGFTG